jgi:hypothetical protein
MGRIAMLLELILSITLLILGLYILHEGSSNKSANEDTIVIGGAVCFTLGATILIFAGKSILSERRMLRHNMPNRYLDDTPERKRG